MDIWFSAICKGYNGCTMLKVGYNMLMIAIMGFKLMLNFGCSWCYLGVTCRVQEPGSK